jgi:hypothetical protein
LEGKGARRSEGGLQKSNEIEMIAGVKRREDI